MSGIGASALAVLAPVKAGAREQLLAALEGLGGGDQGPFAKVPGTHFGRFALVGALTDPTGAPLQSEGSFLLMCADFDPAPVEWTKALCTRAGRQLDMVMSNCEGFPGSGDPAGVTDYFVSHDAPPGFTVAGYRRTTVNEVRAALALKQALRELVVRAQSEGLEGAALREAWQMAVRR